MSKQLIICLGPICSGKTTWSKEQVKNDPTFLRFSFDEFLYMSTLKGDYNENVVWSAASAAAALLSRSSVIVDGFPLEMHQIRRLINHRYMYSSEVTIRLFDVSIKDSISRCIERKKKKGININVEEIHRYHKVYTEFINSEEFLNLGNNVDIIISEFCEANLSLVL